MSVPQTHDTISPVPSNPSNGNPNTQAKTRIEAAADAAAQARAHKAYDRLMTGMAEFRGDLQKSWGDGFPALIDYLAVATTPWQWNIGDLQASIRKNPTAATMILVGERSTTGDRLTNGQYRAALQAVKLVENTRFQLMFTGGVYGLEAFYGERPAFDLMSDFDALTGGVYRRQYSMEQGSQNTGDQARVLGEWIKRYKLERLVICVPIEHIARFAATLAFDLVERGARPDIVFFGNGDWEDVIPQRKITRAREAFGPVQTLDDPDVILVTKRLGAEYGDRYLTEQDLEKSRGYACPALSPREMLDRFDLKL